jgi:glycosyltransferase involved in cell wall biosynthesis
VTNTGHVRVHAGTRGKVIFLAPGDVAKGRVEPIFWMRTCAAYAAAGFDVTLVTLTMRRPDGVPPSGVWSHYGIEPNFRIVIARTPLRRDASVHWFRVWAGLVASKTALVATAGRLLDAADPLLIHTRLPILAAPFLASRRLLSPSRRPRVVFETHALPRREHAWVARNADLVVTNSEHLASELRRDFRLDGDSVLHAPLPPHNPIERKSKLDARRELGVPVDAQLACYTGKMTENQNEFLLQAARAVAEKAAECRFVLVGGNPEVLEWTRRRMRELRIDDGRIIIAGFVPPQRVGVYQSAADVLVHHVEETVNTFPYCTPAKAYEYQAAQRPIVATDIPLFEEVFGEDGERALRVGEHSPEALATGIIRALALDESSAMAERAAAWVRDRTWERRTGQILAALDF